MRPPARSVPDRSGRRCLTLLAIIGLAVSAMAVPSATAQEPVPPSPAPKAPTVISVAFEPSPMDGIPHYLSAQLTTQDGSAVVGERVQIRRTADVFGGRTVTIGRSTTDNAGIARVPVEPREEVYRVTATFGGSDTLTSAEVVDDIVFPLEAVIIPEEVPRGGLVDPQLRPLAEYMPAVIGLAVIVVWLILLGLTVFTLARIRAARRSDDHASASVSAESLGTGPGSQNG